MDYHYLKHPKTQHYVYITDERNSIDILNVWDCLFDFNVAQNNQKIKALVQHMKN